GIAGSTASPQQRSQNAFGTPPRSAAGSSASASSPRTAPDDVPTPAILVRSVLLHRGGTTGPARLLSAVRRDALLCAPRSADDVIHVRNALAKIERSSSSSASSSSAGRQRSRLLDAAWTYGARDSTLKDSGFFVSARSVAAAAAAAKDAEVDIYGHLAFAAVAGEAVLVMGMDKWAFLHARNIAAVRTEREIKIACTFVVVSDSGVEHRFACATSPEYQAWIDALRTALVPRASASPPAIVVERPLSSATLRTPPDSDSDSHTLRRPRSSLLASRIAGFSDAARAAAVVLPPRRPSASTLRSIDSAVSSSSRRRNKQAPEFAEGFELDDGHGDGVPGDSLPRRTDSKPVATDSSAVPARGRARAKPAGRSAAAARRAASAGSVAATHPAAAGTFSPRSNSRHRPVVADADSDEDWRDPAGPSLRLREAGASGSLDRRARSASRPRSHVDLRATQPQLPHHGSAHQDYNYTAPVSLRRTLSTPRSALRNAAPPPQQQPPDHPGFPSRPGSQVRFAAYDELVAHRPVQQESYSPPASPTFSGSSGAAAAAANAAAAAAVAAAAEAGMLPPPSAAERRAWRRRYYEDAFAEPAKVHAAPTTTSTATIPTTGVTAPTVQATPVPRAAAAAAATRSSSALRSASPSRLRAPRAASPSRRRPAADPDTVADPGPLLPLPDRKKFSLSTLFASRNRRDRDDDSPPKQQQPPQLPPLAFAPNDDNGGDDDDDDDDDDGNDYDGARGIVGGDVDDDVDVENDNDDIRPRRARERDRAASPFRPAAAVVAAAKAVAARSRSRSRSPGRFLAQSPGPIPAWSSLPGAGADSDVGGSGGDAGGDSESEDHDVLDDRGEVAPSLRATAAAAAAAASYYSAAAAPVIAAVSPTPVATTSPRATQPLRRQPPPPLEPPPPTRRAPRPPAGASTSGPAGSVRRAIAAFEALGGDDR
ncbi:hypothetical protein HK405_010577, partial [Cladochytrium tenue]